MAVLFVLWVLEGQRGSRQLFDEIKMVGKNQQ
jgi:hypothetical protein